MMPLDYPRAMSNMPHRPSNPSTMRPKRFHLLPALIGVATLVLAGACSSALDEARLEAEISSGFQAQTGVAVRGVDCPAGVPLQAGAIFQCTLTTQEGQAVTIDVTQDDAQGNVSWRVR